MISKKAVGTRINNAVAINARIFTSIILFYFAINNSGFNPIEMITLSPKNPMDFSFPLDDIELDQYHE